MRATLTRHISKVHTGQGLCRGSLDSAGGVGGKEVKRERESESDGGGGGGGGLLKSKDLSDSTS